MVLPALQKTIKQIHDVASIANLHPYPLIQSKHWLSQMGVVFSPNTITNNNRPFINQTYNLQHPNQSSYFISFITHPSSTHKHHIQSHWVYHRICFATCFCILLFCSQLLNLSICLVHMHTQPNHFQPQTLQQQLAQVGSYLIPNSSSSQQSQKQPPAARNFVRDKLKDISKFINDKLQIKQTITSWIQFAKLLFKHNYKYNNRQEWQELRDLIDDVVQQHIGQPQCRQLYGKAMQIAEFVEQGRVQQVIRLIEQNPKKRKKLTKAFMNQARRK